MKLRLETDIPCAFERAVQEVKQPRLLVYIARPLVELSPAEGPAFPDSWEGKTVWLRLHLFGLLPLGKQAVCASVEEVSDRFTLYDRGYSALIRRWDHRIEIRPRAEGIRYSDTLDLDAGVLTPLVWLFARVFFAHRQARWQKLARSGFDFDGG